MKRLLNYLRSPRVAVSLLIYVAYCAFICFMEVKHHVFWRDEVRAFSIAQQADSFSDLNELLQNEGHPILWYILLKSLYAVFHANWVLPLASVLIAMAAGFLWLWFAPFSLLERALFLAGIFPIFEFSVMARNYGISMLLMFLFCTQFQYRKTRPWRAYLPLFLLSLTNAHSTMIVGIVGFALLVEALFHQIFSQKKRARAFISPIAIMGAAGCVVWTLHSQTTSSSSALNPAGMGVERIVQVVVQFLTSPGHALVPYFAFLAPSNQWLFGTFVIVAFGLILIRRPLILLTYLATAGAMSCFSDLVYPLQLRHQGVFFVFWLSCVWIDRSLSAPKTSEAGETKETLPQLPFRYATSAVIVLLMLWQMDMGFAKLQTQFGTEESAANRLVELFQDNPQWKDAVLIGEPDYIMDTIPYYLDNPMYFPRDGSYRKWVLFTREWRLDMSLKELLDTAAQIHSSTGKPVLFLIGTQVAWTPGRAGKSVFGCDRYLTWTPAEVDRFNRETHKVGVFPRTTAIDETYSVYEWLGSSTPRPRPLGN